MMKRLLLPFLLLCCCNLVISQVTNTGNPYSWDELSSKKYIAPVIMDSFDINKVKAEDAVNDLNRSIPWRFGYEFDVNLGLNNAGVWDELSNGDRLWRINIVSKGARTLNFVFSKFSIPRGAKVYLYTNDRSDLLGAYTNIFNSEDQMLGTWLVSGENIWIEYYEPALVKGQGLLTIGKVVHGYRTVNKFESQRKDLNSSGDCNQDVNCPVGNDFEELKDKLKKSVGLIIANGSGFCTGTLINNTNNDRAPYFLTANHCVGNESSWAFRFNWISTNAVCASSANSTDNGSNNFYQTTSGSRVLAKNSGSDFKLLEITGGLDTAWDLEWAGWDRTGDAPSFTAGIHHPSGDIMKVCRDNQSPLKAMISFNGDSNVGVWNVQDWDLGVTEPGSSGSALFNPVGRIIGQLAGGGADCIGLDDNNDSDFYGRLEVSWDSGTTDDTRISNWLDPNGTGRETLDMLSQEIDGGGVVPPVVEDEIIIYNDSPSVLKIVNGANKILDYIIFDLVGKEIASGRLTRDDESIDFSNKSSGVYFIYITDTSDGTSFTRKVIMNKGF